MTGVPALLDCLHTAVFDPQPRDGEEVYCRNCGDYRIVKSAHDTWTLRCSACPLARGYGADEHQARRVATRHANKYAGHVVRVRKGGHVVGNVSAGRGSTTDLLEWLHDHPNHQSGLRNIVANTVIKS